MLAETSSEITCAICLGRILPITLCTTNCNHMFCKSCLDLWFDKNKLSCPICRSIIRYFNHNKNDNRVVGVFKPVVRPGPNPNNPNNPLTILITKKIYFIMNISLAGSIITNCIMIGLWGSCNSHC